jgi:hypothetical protein
MADASDQELRYHQGHKQGYRKCEYLRYFEAGNKSPESGPMWRLVFHMLGHRWRNDATFMGAGRSTVSLGIALLLVKIHLVLVFGYRSDGGPLRGEYLSKIDCHGFRADVCIASRTNRSRLWLASAIFLLTENLLPEWINCL